jgi:amidase
MTTPTAAQIAARVRSGERSAVAEVASALELIREHNDYLDAFAVVRTEQAQVEASEVDARSDRADLPLAGVPVAIKDNIPVAGEPMRVGSLATDDEPQAVDHPVVQRIRQAGGVIIGITRVPELCVFGATDSRYGVTRNPWDLGRTPGGSSGGSAAAVASGMVSIAHGNDGMGSIRIPAACTGLVGIKPGRGVVPADLGETDWYGMSENGPLATTVEDAALLLSVMADRPELRNVVPADKRMRIALSHRPPVAGVAVDPAWAAAAERIAATLRMAGQDVRRADPVYPTSAAIAGLARWFAGTAADADQLDDALLEPRVRRHARIGRAIRNTPAMSDRLRSAWIDRAGEFLNEYDILITPALAQPPLESRRWSDGGWGATMLANIRYAPFAAPWNVAGFPAMVVPAGVHPETGTPVAVQLVAGPGGEGLLLSMAATIEAMHPWQRTAPARV